MESKTLVRNSKAAKISINLEIKQAMPKLTALELQRLQLLCEKRHGRHRDSSKRKGPSSPFASFGQYGLFLAVQGIIEGELNFKYLQKGETFIVEKYYQLIKE